MKKFYFLVLAFFLMSFTIPNNFSYKVLFFINENFVSGQKSSEIYPLLLETLDQTTNDLSFNLKSKSSQIYKTHEANCVGYTSYYNTLLIKNLKERQIGNIKVSHARVKVHFLNMNLHIFKSPSLKDHDISIVKNITTGDVYYVDPSLSEVFGNIIIKQ